MIRPTVHDITIARDGIKMQLVATGIISKLQVETIEEAIEQLHLGAFIENQAYELACERAHTRLLCNQMHPG